MFTKKRFLRLLCYKFGSPAWHFLYPFVKVGGGGQNSFPENVGDRRVPPLVAPLPSATDWLKYYWFIRQTFFYWLVLVDEIVCYSLLLKAHKERRYSAMADESPDRVGLTIELVTRMIESKTGFVTKLNKPSSGEIILFKSEEGI